MPDKLKNVLLLVSSHHAVTSRFYLWMLHKVMLLLSWLHCSAASTKTTSNKWNIGHQLSQIPKEFASAIYRNYCSYTVGIKIILAITTSSSAHQPHLFYIHRPRAGSTVCICEENDQAPNPRLSGCYFCPCLCHDLPRLPRKCSHWPPKRGDWLQRSWAAVLIGSLYHSLCMGSERRSCRLDDLIAYWLDERLPSEVNGDLSESLTGWTLLSAWLSDPRWLMG